jgi:hypothetical protein
MEADTAGGKKCVEKNALLVPQDISDIC